MSEPELRYPRLWQTIGWLSIVALVIVSLIPLTAPALGFSYGDKIAHLIAYTVLAWWFGQLNDALWRVFIALFLLGASLEWLQGMMPYRNADGWDFLADIAGIALGLWLAHTAAGNVLARLDARLR